MSITTYLCVFCSGLAAGMLILFVARKIESGESYSVRVIGKGEARTDNGMDDGHEPSKSAGPDGKN